jgi:hypothetical protein
MRYPECDVVEEQATTDIVVPIMDGITAFVPIKGKAVEAGAKEVVSKAITKKRLNDFVENLKVLGA